MEQQQQILKAAQGLRLARLPDCRALVLVTAVCVAAGAVDAFVVGSEVAAAVVAVFAAVEVVWDSRSLEHKPQGYSLGWMELGALKEHHIQQEAPQRAY